MFWTYFSRVKCYWFLFLVIYFNASLFIQNVDSGVSFVPAAARSLSFDEDIWKVENSSHIRVRRQFPPNKCPIDYVNCYDGSCIVGDSLCDGVADCPDGSDEVQARCQSIKCPPYVFRCSYGACVDKKAKCNGVKDCVDNSDELHKDCFKGLPPRINVCSGDFQCNDNKCIPQEDTCDGVLNCQDGSDETITLCATRGCPKFSFRCAYGGCIDKNKKCDNNIDCVDGSDEEPILCGRPLVPTTTTTTTAAPVTDFVGDGACALPEMPNRGRYVVENSKAPIIPGTRVPAFTFLNYTCPNGYSISDNSAVYCDPSGQWSVVPECYKLCTMPTSYTVDFTCTRNNQVFRCGDKVPFGTVVSFECKRNHFNPGLKKSLMCTDSGSFDISTPKCRPECGLEESKGQAFAINALEAKRGTFPWQVALYSGDVATESWSQDCGGTLISTHLFISAAHCVYNPATEKTYPPSRYSAAVGKLYRAWTHDEDDALSYVQKSQVKAIYVPKRYGGDQQNQQEDIAVLQVMNPFNLSDSVRPACIDIYFEDFNRRQVSHNVLGKVAGWGLTQEEGIPSEKLRTLTMPIIDYNVCKLELDKYQFKRYLTSDKICAGYLNGSALCRGDSGGGLVIPTTSEDGNERWYLRGVVSVGPANQQKTSCRSNTYTAFTEVFKLKDFLVEVFHDLNFELN